MPSGVGLARDLSSIFIGWTLGGADETGAVASAYISDVTLKDERLEKLTPYGVAAYLPAFAGNLDIMTSAALSTGERLAQQKWS